MSKACMRAIACLGVAFWSPGASAERRMMTNPAFGCPSAYETPRVLQMRREGLGVDGHVTEEVDKSSRLYMAEHKCRFLKKGDLVEFEWSNVQKLEPETLGHAVCIRVPNSEECSFTPKNFAEARSSSAPEEASQERSATVSAAPPTPAISNRVTPQAASAEPSTQATNPTPPETSSRIPAPAPQVASSARPQAVETQAATATAPRTSAPAFNSRPRPSSRIELSPL